MTEQTARAGDLAGASPSRLIDRIARSLLMKRLEGLREGRITLVDRGFRRSFGTPTEAFPVEAKLVVNDSRAYADVAFGGSVGAGEAWMAGYWDTCELTDLVRIFARNADVLEGLERNRWTWAQEPARRLAYFLSRNSRRGSRRNIGAHYDLGNDLFALFLDPTMMYSSAIFPRADSTLEEASQHKLDLICRKLELAPSDHVLEIGTGWGGFALHAAARYGCRVTTTTISREQHDLATQRVAAAGLADRVQVLHEDYRDLRGQYDKLVSIEMIEAVGHQYLNGYFRRCAELLRPDGLMLLQAITIADHQYEQAKRSVDFIKKYIFPGGFLPSVSAMLASAGRHTDLRLVHLDDFGTHYARTLRAWREGFHGNLDGVRRLGYDQRFERMWDYYLSYCEGGFIERMISCAQLLLARPGNRRRPWLEQA